MAESQDVKTQLNAFRLRPKQAQSPASSPMSLNFSFPSIVTSLSSSSLSPTSSASSLSSAKLPSSTGTGSSEGSAPSKNRPASHHRRKSSVSTRRESSEIMGIPCPDEVEDNGTMDEVRTRALLALEGRNVATGFAKVEIPDWVSPTVENRAFDWEASKAPMLGTNSSLGKRDSLSRGLVNASTSNKVELHTLVEEDEEEDESIDDSSSLSHVPSTRVIEPSPIKSRPTSLSLRSLSLVGDLPTPDSTPSPRGNTGMRRLTLQASPTISNSPSPLHRPSPCSSPEPMTPMSASVSASSLSARRQTQLAMKRSPTGSDASIESLHNPLTPLCMPQSSDSSAASGDRPLSPTEVFAQHAYARQNYASLLERIATLEEALDSEKHKSSSADELIALVADLKAERDQLHSNVAGAVQKHTELERAGDICKKRLEAARQEAWLHKDRAEILQVEVDRLNAEGTAFQFEKAAWAKERNSIMKEKQARDTELKLLQELCERLKRELQDSQHPARRYMSSVDSRSSSATTFVDDSDSSFDSFRISAPKLKDANPDLASVAEVDEFNHDGDSYDDKYDEGSEMLASYEAEPTECMNYDDQYSDEDEDLSDESTSTPAVKMIAPTPRPQHKHASSHARSASLVTSWRFPRGPNGAPAKKQPECDPFRIGLDEDEDGRDVTPLSIPRVLGIQMRPNTPTKKIPSALAETFAMNFQEDENFAFGGTAESIDVAGPKSAPATESSKPWTRSSGLSYRDQSNVLGPGRGPVASTFPTAFPANHLSQLHGDLVPPPKVYSRQVGDLIAPIVPKISPPKAQIPTTPQKTAVSSSTSAQRPVHLFTPPPRVTDVSRRSSAAPPSTAVSSSDLADQFSFFSSPSSTENQAPRPPSSKNVVEFPTTSASPFSVRLSLSSFASFMPWSPTRSQQPIPSPSLAAQVEAIQGKRAAVNPDVMRERLRARLVQEGKIAGANELTHAPVSRSSTPTPAPGRSGAAVDHICTPGCIRCRSATVQC